MQKLVLTKIGVLNGFLLKYICIFLFLIIGNSLVYAEYQLISPDKLLQALPKRLKGYTVDFQDTDYLIIDNKYNPEFGESYVNAYYTKAFVSSELTSMLYVKIKNINENGKPYEPYITSDAHIKNTEIKGYKVTEIVTPNDFRLLMYIINVPEYQLIVDITSKSALDQCYYIANAIDLDKLRNFAPEELKKATSQIDNKKMIFLGRENLKDQSINKNTSKSVEQTSLTIPISNLPSNLEAYDFFSSTVYPELLNLFSSSEISKKEARNVISDINKLIELDPNYILAYYMRALVYVALGDYREVLNDANKLIDSGYISADIYALRGKANIHLRNFRQGQDDYDKAIKLNPSSADYYYYERGSAYKEMGRTAQAQGDLNNACKLNRNYCERCQGIIGTAEDMTWCLESQ